MAKTSTDTTKQPGFISRTVTHATEWGVKTWKYVSADVWADISTTWKTRLIKTVNLTVRSFLNADLQSRACALTFRTLLAIVPALALLFAIGRGFGFQNVLTSSLFSYFPAQQRALETACRFVDSYLAQASEGIFVGIGILFLLWTLISLLSSVEDVFNIIWGVKRGRTMWRKITDYTAIFLVLPILMICSSGLTIFFTSIQAALPHNVISPLFKIIIDFSSVALTWLFFTGVYMLIPNTKVKLKNALVSGILAGIAYQVIQWLFVSGQVYVSKYNAIYGGFAFLPLLLLWMQLVWLITLSGAVLCYSSQNIFQFSFFNESKDVSIDYRRVILVSVMAVIQQRFTRNMPPLRPSDFVQAYTIPTRLIEEVVNDLEEAHLVSRVADAHEANDMALQPAHDLSATTVGDIVAQVDSLGASGFIPGFDSRFKTVIKALNSSKIASSTLLNDLKIDLSCPNSAV